MKKRQYLLTERPHLMCPNMYFGIKARINGVYDANKIKAVLQRLEDAHPFLQSLIAREQAGNRFFYEYQEENHLEIIEKEDVENWQKDYQKLTSSGWNVMTDNLLKVVVYPLAEQFEVMFIAHHLLGDGRGILGLMEEFADCYVAGKAPVYVEEQLMTSLDDLPDGSDLPFISKAVVNSANKNWLKEKQEVTYQEYLAFEKEFLKKNPVKFIEETVDATTVEKLRSNCKKVGITINDYLVAEMMCQEHTNKIIVAADIRKYLSCYQKGALGNYATAMGIVSKKKADDVWEKSKEVSIQIRKHMDKNNQLMLIIACYFRMIPDLLDAVSIATLGDYQSKAGKFVGSAMFGYEKRNGYSVTNLGNIQNPNMLEGMFIPPASPANNKTMGVLSVNGKMKKCTSVCIQ